MDYNSRYNEWLEKLTDSDPLKAELQLVQEPTA